MKEPKTYLTEFLRYLKDMDRATFARVFSEAVNRTNKQLFSQIPGFTAVAGIMVGTQVASTFTNLPVKGFISSWGLMKGGTRVVSTTACRPISVALPILVTALIAYRVRNGLKRYRQKRLERNMAYVVQMGKVIQERPAWQDRHSRQKTREAGLLAENEYQAKFVNLYQACSRND